jgi:hypothetical protein
MNWLERAAREISGMAGTPADETAKTSLSSVLAVPQMDISKESGAADADRAAPERAKPKFAGPLPARPCATCMHFRAIPGDAPDGHCRRFKVATWGAYAHGCAAGWAPQEQPD